MDEITNVSRDYFGSCYYMLLHEVIKPLNVPLENYIMPKTTTDDWNAECEWFERILEEKGPVDLQILGIGGNGHIGFNQPGTAFGQTTWVSVMEPWLYERIRTETNSPEGTDLGGITLGIKNVMQSRRIILAANGNAKAEIMEAFLDITPGSLSVLGLMNDKENRVQLLIDEDVLKEEYFGCHPCINTSSIRFKTEDLEKILIPALKHEPRLVKL